MTRPDLPMRPHSGIPCLRGIAATSAATARLLERIIVPPTTKGN